MLEVMLVDKASGENAFLQPSTQRCSRQHIPSILLPHVAAASPCDLGRSINALQTRQTASSTLRDEPAKRDTAGLVQGPDDENNMNI